MYKVIYIDRIADRSPNVASNIKDEDNYFTIGWGCICSRKFKEFNPDVKVECWKTDYKSQKIYEREISGVIFKIFPAYHIKHLGDYSRSLLGNLRKELKSNEPTIIHITSFRHLLFYSIALKLKDYPLVVQNNGESSALYKVKISRGIKKLFYFLQMMLEKKSFRNIDLLYILDERLKAFLPQSGAVIKKQTLGIMPERFTPLNKKEARHLLNLEPDYKYLSAADVYILPKYSVEHIFGGIGLLPVEALLCNTPIIGGSLENFPQEYRESVGLAVSDKEEMKNAIYKIIDKKIT